MPDLLQINHAQLIDRGRKKRNNEDYVTSFIPEKQADLTNNGSLFILADGVGGASLGEIASKYAADLVLHDYYHDSDLDPGERLVQAFMKANRDIYSFAEESERHTKMATTLVAALIFINKLIVANVGDSRAYLIRKGQIKQITRDHSVVAEMVRNGSMTEAEAQVSSIRNRLSRSIGGQQDVTVDLFPPIPLEIGDRILLCSDGLSRYAAPQDLVNMASNGDLKENAQRLIRFANHQGGVDNISVIIIDMVQTAIAKKPVSASIPKPPKIEEWQQAETVLIPANTTLKRQKDFPILLIAIGLAVILGVIGVWQIISKSAKKPVAQLSMTDTPFTQVEQQQSSPLPSNQMETGTPETQQGSTSPENKAAENTKDLTNIKAWECVYYWEGGLGKDYYLFNVLEKFGQKHNPEKSYDYYQTCEVIPNNEYLCGDNVCVRCETDTIENLIPEQHKTAYDKLQGKWLVFFSPDNQEIAGDNQPFDYEKAFQTCAGINSEGKIHLIFN